MSDVVSFTPRVSEVAREKLIVDVEAFLTEFPQWNRTTLQRVAGVDERFLRRVESGKSWQTRNGDKLQETMEAIARGEIVSDTEKALRRKHPINKEKTKDVSRAAKRRRAAR